MNNLNLTTMAWIELDLLVEDVASGLATNVDELSVGIYQSPRMLPDDIFLRRCDLATMIPDHDLPCSISRKRIKK